MFAVLIALFPMVICVAVLAKGRQEAQALRSVADAVVWEGRASEEVTDEKAELGLRKGHTVTTVGEVEAPNSNRGSQAELDTERSSARAHGGLPRTPEQQSLQRRGSRPQSATFWSKSGGWKISRSKVGLEPSTSDRAKGEKRDAGVDDRSASALRPSPGSLHYEGGSDERRASTKGTSPHDGQLALPPILEDGEEAHSHQQSQRHDDKRDDSTRSHRRNDAGSSLQARRPEQSPTLAIPGAILALCFSNFYMGIFTVRPRCPGYEIP